MRLAFLTTEFAGIGHPDGGLGNYLRRIGPLLARAGHEVEVFLCSAWLAPVARDSTRTSEGVALHHLAGAPITRPEIASLGAPEDLKLWVHGAWRLAEALAARHAQAPFEAVQVSNWGLPGLFVDLRVPLVMRFSSYEPLWRRGQGGPRTPGQGALEILERQAVLNADAHYAPSQFLARHLKEELGLEVEVLRPPAYLEIAPDAWDRAWHARATRAATPYFLYVGTLSPLKGADLLAGALARFWAVCPEAHLHLAGRDGGGHKLWVSFPREREKRIHQHGLQPHERIHPLLQGALAALVPSRVDNLPNVAIEALLCGTPVIGFRGTSLEELVADGRGGWLVEADDAAAFADAMVRAARLSQAEREAVGQAGREHVARELDPAAAAEKLLALCQAAGARPCGARVPREVRLRVVCQDLKLLFEKEWLAPALELERDRWRQNYEQLAGAFPVRQLLWLRRRLKGIPDPPKEQG